MVSVSHCTHGSQGTTLVDGSASYLPRDGVLPDGCSMHLRVAGLTAPCDSPAVISHLLTGVLKLQV